MKFIAFSALVLAITNRAENLCYQFRHGYNSSHSFAKLSAWWSALCAQADKWKLIRSLLVHEICNFEDEIKTVVRELAERTFNENSYEAFLYYYPTHSKTEHEPQGGEPLLKLRCGNVNRPRRHSERSVGIPKTGTNTFGAIVKNRTCSRNHQPRREFALSIQTRIITQTAVLPNYLLDDVPDGTFFN